MAELIVLKDILRGARERHALKRDAILAHEIMRLFPRGIVGTWELYIDQIDRECYLPLASHESHRVDAAATYYLVIKPGTGIVEGAFLWNLIASLALTAITYFLTPKPKRAQTEGEENASPNNLIAGQSNALRPGARVPDILGAVRAYPDLLCAPIETWTARQQTIKQFFVVGVGDYECTEGRLGDTPITGWQAFAPGTTVPQTEMVKTAPEVAGVSLMPEDETSIPTTGASFTASTKTMSTSALVAIDAGVPILISGTLSNNGLFWTVSVPAPGSTTGPFLYVLEGPVANEASANPVIALPASRGTLERDVHFGTGSPLTPTPTAQDARIIMGLTGAVVGDPYQIVRGGTTYRGRVTYVQNVIVSIMPAERMDTIIRMNDLTGGSITFAAGTGVHCQVTSYEETPPPAGPPPSSVPVAWTSWYTAPMQNPTEIWIDIAFPAGLVWYASGVRNTWRVIVRAEFRRVGSSTTVTRDFDHSGQTNGALRWTEKVNVDALALPAGSASIEVRLKRQSNFQPDDATNQYVQDTRFERLAAMRWMDAMAYPNVTVIALVLTNTRNATSMGESTFNVVATRRLPTWSGSAWSAPAPSEKWADALVARMKADDGAAKDDIDIDVAGIYAIQSQLDAMDSGDQGKISMTLDKLQDVDAELQTIAAVARATIFRVGRKLYVNRDQGNKTPLSLITGRSKSPEAETVTLAMRSDTEPDAVIVQWIDRAAGWKTREFQYPADVLPLNALRVSPVFANFAQAYRRARYEWARIRLRRDTLTVDATEEARLLRPGDVIQVTDDVANLAQTAGEVLAVQALTLKLDVPIDVSAGGFTITLRGLDGRTLDAVPIASQGGTLYQVNLSRESTVPIKGRDDGMGTVYAIYQSALAVIRPWLVTGLEPGAPYTRILAENYREDVYDGDSGTVPAPARLRSFTTDVNDVDTQIIEGA